MRLTEQEWELLREARRCHEADAYEQRFTGGLMLGTAEHACRVTDWERLFHKLEGGDPAMKKAKPAAKKAAAKPAPKAGKPARKGCCK